MFGSGRQTRSFSYVTDTVDGILRITNGLIISGDIINIGCSIETQSLHLANEIGKITNSVSKNKLHHLPEDDPKLRYPDTRKISIKLKGEPRIGLSEGLNKTIE